MSELSDALGELQEAYDATLGSPQTVQIDGSSYPARYDDVTFDELVMAGANGEAGGFRVSVAADRFADPPERGTSIEGRGMELQVLTVIDRNGTEYDLTCGDIASQEDPNG